MFAPVMIKGLQGLQKDYMSLVISYATPVSVRFDQLKPGDFFRFPHRESQVLLFIQENDRRDDTEDAPWLDLANLTKQRAGLYISSISEVYRYDFSSSMRSRMEKYYEVCFRCGLDGVWVAMAMACPQCRNIILG